MANSRTIYANDFLARMAVGRQNALNRRYRGMAVGAHASWNVKRSDYAPTNQDDGHATAISAMGERWRSCRIDALEDYLRLAFPERYEAFE